MLFLRGHFKQVECPRKEKKEERPDLSGSSCDGLYRKVKSHVLRHLLTQLLTHLLTQLLTIAGHAYFVSIPCSCIEVQTAFLYFMGTRKSK